MSAPDLSKLTIDRGAKSFVPTRKRRWLNKWTIAAAVVILVVAAMSMRAARAPATVEVATVTTAYPTAAITLLNATGRVAAWRKAAVSTNATAARANLEQGEAEMRDAESSYKRAEDLYEKKFISESSLDTARARYEKAKAGISSLRASIGVADANARQAGVQVEQTLIRAPFNGIVLTKNANVGDIITPFSSAADSKGAVVNMADMDTLEVEADVSEASISKIKEGMPAEIQLDAYTDMRLLGKVSRIVPTVDRTKATLLVKVKFVEKDARVLPDMSAKVAFLSRAPKPEERKPVTAVRPEAVVKRGDRDVVYLVQDGNVVKEVAVGKPEKLGDLVRVSGVKAGDKVVLSPPERVRDAATVTLAKK